MRKAPIISDPNLDKLLSDYETAKAKEAEIKEYRSWIEDQILEHYSSHSITSDFEGTETIETPTRTVKMTYKLTKKMDEANLKFYAKEYNLPLEQICNVKYEYSATRMKALPDDIRNEIAGNCVTATRAKTGFEIKIKASKEE